MPSPPLELEGAGHETSQNAGLENVKPAWDLGTRVEGVESGEETTSYTNLTICPSVSPGGHGKPFDPS